MCLLLVAWRGPYKERVARRKSKAAPAGWDRMAVFRAYAKVLEPGDPAMRI